MAIEDNGSTILVVEDDLDALQFLTEMLEYDGHTVLVAKSGETALALLQAVTPDAILMDALMPGIDGFETTRRIKQRPEFSDLPVIFMTGLSAPEHAVGALEVGGVDYIRKPIVVQELLARVKVHVSNAKQSRAGRTALDSMGRHLISMTPSGRLIWLTGEADRILSDLDSEWTSGSETVPMELLRFLETHPQQKVPKRIEQDDKVFEVVIVGRSAEDEITLRLREIREGEDVEMLAAHFSLTQREAEVLEWITYGKPNRVISEILGVSPRTVNKHLEHIFEKLGVETRAAAAAFAVRFLAQ